MRKRIFASLLALVMLLSLLPTTVLAASEDGTDDETPAATVETSDSNADSATPDEPEPPSDGDDDNYYETDEVTDPAGPTAEEQLAELIAALPDPEEIDPLDEEQVEAVYEQIAEIYAFAEENGLDVEDNETINAVIAAVWTAEPMTVEPSYTWYSVDATAYTISTVADLLGFANIVNGTATNITADSFQDKTVALGADIDLSGIEWTPIGITAVTSESGSESYTDHSFQGTFDGQNHTISNLTMTSSNTSIPGYRSMDTDGYYAYGFFGGVNDGTVKNIKFSGVSIVTPGEGNNNNTVAAAVGAAIHGATIENVTIESGSITGKSRTAGVVGYVGGSKDANNSAFSDENFAASSVGTITVKNCTNRAAIHSNMLTSSYGTAAGICATVNQKKATSGTVRFEENENTGTIYGNQSAGILASGFSNNADGASLTIELVNNVNSGIVTAQDEANSNPSSMAAGIANLHSAATLTCAADGNTNSGRVMSSHGYASGIISSNSALSITFGDTGNTNHGSISGVKAGGIVAAGPVREITFANLTNTGDVTATGGPAGGIVGELHTGNILDGNTCTNTGTISGSTNTGMLAGWVQGNTILKNISDDEAIGAVQVSGGANYTVTLDNVNVEILKVLAAHNNQNAGNPYYWFTFALTNNSAIEKLEISGDIHTGMDIAVSGGKIGEVNFANVTGQNNSNSNVLRFKADGSTAIDTVTADSTNNLLSIAVTVTDGSSVDTVRTACGNVTVGEDTAPTNVIYMANTLDNIANSILSGTNSSDSKTKAFTGVELTDNVTLSSSLTIAENKTLIVAEDTTLDAGSSGIYGDGKVVVYGTLTGGSSSNNVYYIVTLNLPEQVTADKSLTTEVESGKSYEVTFTPNNGYSVTAKINDKEQTVTDNKLTLSNISAAITIDVFVTGDLSKATVTLSQNSYTYDGTAKTPAVTVKLGDTILTQGEDYTVSYANNTEVGTATVTITPAEGSIYAETATATFTIQRASGGSHSSGGSGSSTTYAVTVDSAKNGTVKADRTSASKGATVTLTVIPKDGYELDELTVTDKNGDTVKLTKSSDTKYTFTMPASKVTVEASFVEIKAAPDEGLRFVDVAENAYYYDAVAWAVENGITGGTSATTFSPNQACTRAQAVTFLWRAAGSPALKTASNPFTDVSTSAYYYDAVLWAVENGITAGTSATTFSPDNTCTRGQIVTFLYRADGTAANGNNPFADVSADAYYAGPVAWAVAEGITAGTSATTFSPNDACTRAQIVTFIFRAEA